MIGDGAQFDYIFVGSDPANNIVAGRPIENPDVTVLKIEAGVRNPKEIEIIPEQSEAMETRSSERDLEYNTTIVKREGSEWIEKLNTGSKINQGSSAFNYFNRITEFKPTYEFWSENEGNEWIWDALLPFMRKRATCPIDGTNYRSSLKKNSSGGPIHVLRSRLITEMRPFLEPLTTDWKSRGRQIMKNNDDGETHGVMHRYKLFYQGQSTGHYFFEFHKPKIAFTLDLRSGKSISDYAGCIWKCVAVIDSMDKEHGFRAFRKVVLLRRSFDRMKLLVFSGIYPTEELARFGIDFDFITGSNHVGKHLLDHQRAIFFLHIADSFGIFIILTPKGPKKYAIVADFNKDPSGPVGTGLLEMVGFLRIDNYPNNNRCYRKAWAANFSRGFFSPNGQLHFELDFVFLLSSDFNWHVPSPKKGECITFVVDLASPVPGSIGVAWRSIDPLIQPDINIHFFTDYLDIIFIRKGI